MGKTYFWEIINYIELSNEIQILRGISHLFQFIYGEDVQTYYYQYEGCQHWRQHLQQL